MKAYTCETCGMSFTYEHGKRPRWCPDDRAEARRRRPLPIGRAERLEQGLACTVVNQRLAIEQAIHALTCAALARQLDWDDATWLDAALQALHDVASVREAAA